MMFRLLRFVAVLAVATAYSTTGPQRTAFNKPIQTQQQVMAPPSKIAAAAATAALAFMLVAGSPQQAMASSTAGQISLKSLPPTSVKVDIQDLPLIGNLISGTYTKVEDGTIKNPSVSIASPRDKIGAIKAVATGGHLEFDVNGIIGTHLDVDIAAENAGTATVKVSSPLIPQLPFQNSASAVPVKFGAKASDWFSVTNMGNGETYFFNEKKDITQFEKPQNI